MNGSLPEDVVRIITECQVKEVAFIFDSDWNDISTNIKINDQVESVLEISSMQPGTLKSICGHSKPQYLCRDLHRTYPEE